MLKTSKTAQELYKQYGYYSTFRVGFTPHKTADTQSWYTIQPGESSQEVIEQMEQRYPSDAGYTFVQIDSIPMGEDIILPE